MHYATDTGDRSMYLPEDSSLAWKRIGGVGNGQSGDWLEHNIGIHAGHNHVMVGGTNKDFILRAPISSE